MATTESARDKAGPSRPGVRPKHPSRHHLEPNPFEQSFSSKPSDRRSSSPDNSRSTDDGKSDRHTSQAEGASKNGQGERGGASERGEHAKKHSGSGPLTPGSALSGKSSRILPPVSSIASPAAQETSMHYPWGSQLSSSLRAGPLSPAMLTGPQHFDSFRSGFTPDLSNFKTGLTPIGATGGYPPASPNTAAFLAMMNSTGGSGLSGTAITPGTLSVLTGNPMESHGANGAHAEGNKQNHGHGHSDSQDYGYFVRNANEGPSKVSSARATIDSHNQNQQEQAGPSNPAQREGPNAPPGGTKQAASGLFLLSQAHQELSKREGSSSAQQAGGNHTVHGIDGNHDLKPHSLYSDVAPGGGKPGAANRAPNSKGTVGPGKRKKGGPDSDGHGIPSKAAGKRTKAESADPGSPDYESDELGDEMSHGRYMSRRSGSQAGSDGGNDEEKRKNFLERNRQAALKCRQRKKAWLSSLQAKVEYLQADNEGLQGTVGALRNEVMFYKSQLMQAQRQLAAHGLGPAPGMEAGPPPPGGMVPRNGMGGAPAGMDMAGGGGPIGLPNGLPHHHHHPHHMGPPSQQQQHHPMAAANGQYTAVPGNVRQGQHMAAGNGNNGAGMPFAGAAQGSTMHAVNKQPPHGARHGPMQAV